MNTCRASGRDGGGLTPEQRQYYCSGDPWTCGHFNPNRYFCPSVRTSGGWSAKKYNEWRVWRRNLNVGIKKQKPVLKIKNFSAINYIFSLLLKTDNGIVHMAIIGIIILIAFWVLKPI